MKRIDTSQIVSVTSKQPFTGRSLEFLQTALDEDKAAIIKAIVTANVGSYSLTVPYVISGCVVSDTNKDVTAGELFYGGKYYETTALNGVTNVAQFILTQTQDATADPLTFTDNVDKNVHNIFKYVPTDTATPSTFDATDLVYLTSNVKVTEQDSNTGGTSTITTTPADLVTLTPSTSSFNDCVALFSTTIQHAATSPGTYTTVEFQLKVNGSTVKTHKQTVEQNGEFASVGFSWMFNYTGSQIVKVTAFTGSSAVNTLDTSLIFKN